VIAVRQRQEITELSHLDIFYGRHFSDGSKPKGNLDSIIECSRSSHFL
jgi:hypothetical protein